jgi:hypothetical protein
MGRRPIGDWSAWRVGLVSLGWVIAVVGYIAIRTALTPPPPAMAGPDSYYISVHLHYPKLVFLGPPLLLVALWLWQRRTA